MVKKRDHIEALVRQLRRVLNKYARVESMPIRLEDGTVLSTREIHTIQAIGQQEPINVTDVAHCFGVTKSAASQMVARLNEKGFLEKNISAHSNKEYMLSLTKSGQEAFELHEQLHGEGLRNVVDSLSAFSLTQLQVLPKLLEVFEDALDARLEA